MAKITEKALQARFAEISDLVTKIEAKSGAIRQKRDRHVNDARERENKLNDEIRDAEKDLFDLKSEQGMIVRALKGRAAGDSFGVARTAPAEDATAPAA